MQVLFHDSGTRLQANVLFNRKPTYEDLLTELAYKGYKLIAQAKRQESLSSGLQAQELSMCVYAHEC